MKGSTSNWMQDIVFKVNVNCPNCNMQLIKWIWYNTLPDLLILEYSGCNIITNHEISINVHQKQKVLHLKGVVYYGGYHFTSRFISESGITWYHNGMTTGRLFNKDKDIKSMSDVDIRKCDNRFLVFAVYAQK